LQFALRSLSMLLNVPSHSRWPLEVHIFDPELWTAWQKLPSPLAAEAHSILRDFEQGRTIAHLDPTYSSIMPHLEKALHLLDPAQDSLICTICLNQLNPKEDSILACPHTDCNAVTHLRCSAEHFSDSTQELLPVSGNCPECAQSTRWVDLVREFTLRKRTQPATLQKMIATHHRRLKRQERGESDAETETETETELESESDAMSMMSFDGESLASGDERHNDDDYETDDITNYDNTNDVDEDSDEDRRRTITAQDFKQRRVSIVDLSLDP
jgi:structure-specific endonuclease subunit SLX1